MMLALLSPFIFSPINRLRGGGFKPTAKLAGANAYIAAGLLGMWVALCTHNLYAAGAFIAAYIIGEAPGWGKWLAALGMKESQADYANTAIGLRQEGREYGIHQLANAIVKEKEDYKTYAAIALIFRGALWAVPIMLALAFTGAVNPWMIVPAIFALAISFPAAYLVALRIHPEGYWPLGEWIYGAVQGIVIGASLWSHTL